MTAPASGRHGIRAAADCVQQGDRQGARALCTEILAEDPSCAEALHLLAGVSACEGDYATALALARRAAALRPDDLALAHNSGVICSAMRLWEEAAECFGRVLKRKPDDDDALLGYAAASHELRRFDEAAGACERALSAGAPPAGACLQLARSLFALDRFDAAAAACARSIEAKPDDPQAYVVLGDICGRRKQFEQKLVCAEIGIRLRPDSPDAIARLGLACADTGDTARSVALLRRSLSIRPEAADVRSLLLCMLLHDPAQTPEQLLEEHRAWARTHTPRPCWTAWENSPDPDRRIRLGYVCGEFVTGPFAYFLLPVLENHDRERFEIYCYHCRTSEDATTGEFRRLATEWRDAGALSDESLCELIRNDRIDILVDLSGHYPFSRLKVFARHPAPVQAAFPNYPSTTGLGAVDYILTDRWTTPEGSESQYAERVWRLDPGYLTYLAPRDAPPVTASPAVRNRAVTFGLFQRGAKLNEGVWDAIAAVMTRVPGSRLLVHNASRDLDDPGSRSCHGVLQTLGARGISPERVSFRGARGLREHLRLIGECDIGLDTFPYSGQTTTCECLWMGVPVVTIAGRAHVARVGAAVLARAGMQDWIAGSQDEYVAIAARAALDLDGLAALRARLRERTAASMLADHAGVTRGFEAAYREMWRERCAGRRCVPI